MKEKRILLKYVAAAALIFAVSIPVRADSVSKVQVPLNEEIYSVLFPVINEEGPSPFDFIIDPQNMLFKMGTSAYGGGTVEEGANILFYNHDGEYGFSSHSDGLKVYNRSTVPVAITISARMTRIDGIELVDSPDFEDADSCQLYMALVDDDGNEIPLKEDIEVSHTVEMRKAPDNAYCYSYDEESASYRFGLSTDPKNIDFDSYSFGLTGSCNPKGNWWEIRKRPRVVVNWKVEPLEDEEPEAEELEVLEEETSEPEEDKGSVSDNSLEEDPKDSEIFVDDEDGSVFDNAKDENPADEREDITPENEKRPSVDNPPKDDKTEEADGGGQEDDKESIWH